jgi:hypothetical protein
VGELRNSHPEHYDPDYAYRVSGLVAPFGRGVSHGDIDGAIESNGHHLFIEFKHPGESMGLGQIFSLSKLVYKGDTVFVVYAEQHGGVYENCMVVTAITIMQRDKGFTDPVSYSIPASLQSFHDLETVWFQLAASAPPPSARRGVFES